MTTIQQNSRPASTDFRPILSKGGFGKIQIMAIINRLSTEFPWRFLILADFLTKKSNAESASGHFSQNILSHDFGFKSN